MKLFFGMLKRSLIIFLIINKIIFVYSQGLFVFQNSNKNQNCRIQYSGQLGVCRRFSTCQSAQYDYRYQGLQPTTCYFDRLDPVVCCSNRNQQQHQQATTVQIPTTTVSTTSKPNNSGSERISAKKCSGYIPNRFGIVGGVKTKPKEFPFMAVIGWKNFDNEYDFNCGGFLVSRIFVVTAAHCATLGGARPDIVKIGGENLGSTSLYNRNIPIEKVIIHPKYNRRQTYNDIALIKLSELTSNMPACLWQTDNIPNFNEALAIGYGHTQFGGIKSEDLLKVNLKLFSNQECSSYYKAGDEIPNGLINSQLCAGDPTGTKDTCQGDSGGPLFVRFGFSRKAYIIGLTSFGSGCAGGTPSIYTRISSYLDWIESIVWPDG